MNAMVAPIEGLTPRVQEIGRIRMGEKSKSGYPVKLKTFRLTSNDKKVLEAAVALYGGKVEAWPDAPDEGMWQVTTAASELDILIPRSLRAISQAWELWQGGTCERRCDGRIEELSGSACICGPARGSADEFCDVVTRLSVILPRLPGLGVWRLDTGGWGAATTIPSTVELLLALDARPMVPATLRAVQASSKVRGDDGKVVTHRFVRPQLDAPGITIGQLVGSGATEPVAQLEPGERPVPPTAAERVALQRAAVEAAKAPAAVSTTESAAALTRERFGEIVAGEGLDLERARAIRLSRWPDQAYQLTDQDRAFVLDELRKPLGPPAAAAPVAGEAVVGELVEPDLGW